MSSDPKPITVDEDRWMRMKPKAVGWLVGLVVVATASWLTIKFDMVTLRRDVTEHSKTLELITTTLDAIEKDAKAAREVTAKIERTSSETAAKIERNVSEASLKAQYNQELLNQKLDQIMAEKRGVPR